MAKRNVSEEGRRVLNNQSTVFEFTAKNNTLSGIYRGSREIATRFGDTVIYDIETDDGDTFGVWDCATLSKPMEQVNEGERVEIVFKGLGKAKTVRGKKYNPPKIFEVAVFDDHVDRNPKRRR